MPQLFGISEQLPPTEEINGELDENSVVRNFRTTATNGRARPAAIRKKNQPAIERRKSPKTRRE
ncbi:MAG: hypothetical protein LBM17_05945 [Candidatus Accumulibacter sp.]|jgi:hypothetical protein|nr:hypothetical protein [Accumulibacter sp.]